MSSTESSFARGENEATGSLLAAQYPQTCKGKVIFYYAYSLFLGEGEQDSQEKDKKIKKLFFRCSFCLFLPRNLALSCIIILKFESEEKAMSKKYFWLKLKNDFYSQPEIKLMLAGEQGAERVVFYQRLLLMSLEHNGYLRYSQTKPYDCRMLSVLTENTEEFVQNSLSIFVDLGVLEIQDDGTLYLPGIVDCVGSETEWAEKKRMQRCKKEIVPDMSSDCPTDIDINPYSDTKSEIKNQLDWPKSNENGCYLPLKNGEHFNLTATSVDELAKAYPCLDILREVHRMSAWLKDNPSKQKTKNKINQFINNWLANEQSKGVPKHEKSNGTDSINAEHGSHGEWV
jgi:predicted phage replisome organizer